MRRVSCHDLVLVRHGRWCGYWPLPGCARMTMTGFDYLATMTEAQLQNQIINIAKTFAWTVYHTHDSRRSQPGFPDLVLTRSGLLIFAELKSQRGNTSKEQARWLAELEKVHAFAPNVIVRLWRPADLDGIAKLLHSGWRVEL